MPFTYAATSVDKFDQFKHCEESESNPQVQNAAVTADDLLVGHGRRCFLHGDFLGLNRNWI